MSERFYRVGSIFIQNGDFAVTVGKLDAKTLERDKSDVTVGTKNSNKRVSKTNRIEPTLTTLAHTDLSTSLAFPFKTHPQNPSEFRTRVNLVRNRVMLSTC